MAQNEPKIPVVEGDGIIIDDKTKEENGKPAAAKSGTDEVKKDEASSNISKDQYDQLVEGWKEDREYFQGEIRRLRAEAADPTFTKKEEEELADIDDPDERAERRFEFKQKRQEDVEKAEIEVVRSEIRFLKRTDSEFRENEKAIIKVASDYDCQNLKQAILIWKGLNRDKAAKDKEYNDERKKEADGRGGGNAGGSPAGRPAQHTPGKKMSFSDMYAEGLGKK